MILDSKSLVAILSQQEENNSTLNLNDQNLTKISSSLFNLQSVKSHFSTITRLNLSNNNFGSSEKLVQILLNTPCLRHLDISSCGLVEIVSMAQHVSSSLMVLNIANNQVMGLTPHMSRLVNLKALIMNNNNLETITNLETLKLQTLIVSKNKLKKISNINMQELEKLNGSHNQIEEFDAQCNTLKELRLNGNLLEKLDLKSCSNLSVLDAGNNLLEELHLPANLVQLNLKGGNEGLNVEEIKKNLLKLRIFNGVRFDEKFLKRKQVKKRKLIEEKKKTKQNEKSHEEIEDSTRQIEKQEAKVHQEKKQKKLDKKDEKQVKEGTDASSCKEEKIENNIDKKIETKKMEKKIETKKMEKKIETKKMEKKIEKKEKNSNITSNDIKQTMANDDIQPNNTENEESKFSVVIHDPKLNQPELTTSKIPINERLGVVLEGSWDD